MAGGIVCGHASGLPQPTRRGLAPGIVWLAAARRSAVELGARESLKGAARGVMRLARGGRGGLAARSTCSCFAWLIESSGAIWPSSWVRRGGCATRLASRARTAAGAASRMPELRAAQAHGVEEAIVRAIMHAASAFNPNALSRAGAQGLMQLMPATAARFGVVNAFDPEQNIRGGVKRLAGAQAVLGKEGARSRQITNRADATARAFLSPRGVKPQAQHRRLVRPRWLCHRHWRRSWRMERH